MRYVDEYRDPEAIRDLVALISATATKPWTIMEICGGQTHSIVKFGLDQLIPNSVELLHGPGCPVCVTPLGKIDAAIEIASSPGVTLCSFGDMLRVPGSKTDLLTARARGADVRVVYSPMDALALARELSDRQIVFFGVGFETTAPANAMAIHRAKIENLKNFSMIISHVLVPPAMTTILASPENRVDGFLAAGHVCTIMGTKEYEPIAARFRVPIVVTGFEPLDILEGIYLCLKQLEAGRCVVENQYARSVRTDGNAPAQAMINAVFSVDDTAWRGLGTIAASGLKLRREYWDFDAERRFQVARFAAENPRCQSGRVLTGAIKPARCPEFGVRCTPASPLGAPMVSTEGACAAYYTYKSGTRHVQ